MNRKQPSLAEERQRCREILAAHPLFSWLNADLIQNLAAQAAVSRHAEGQWIYRRGTPSEGIGIVAEGEVLFISGHESNPEEQEASTCEAGEIFGELSLIDPRPRRADARAQLDTTVYVLRIGLLEKFAARHPEQFAVLLTNLARHLARRLRALNARRQVHPTEGAS